MKIKLLEIKTRDPEANGYTTYTVEIQTGFWFWKNIYKPKFVLFSTDYWEPMKGWWVVESAHKYESLTYNFYYPLNMKIEKNLNKWHEEHRYENELNIVLAIEGITTIN